VSAGDPVLLLRHRDGRGLDTATALLGDAVIISETPPPARPLIVETITHV
jgi:pyrimidine-nucleoside phosphorylase/thymidine phosphorylase